MLDMATPTLHINQPRLPDEQSLADRAYYAIRELIVTLELAPGSVVSERRSHGTARAWGGHRCARRSATSPGSSSSRCSRAAESSSPGWTSGTSRVSPRSASCSRRKAARLAAERRSDADREETQALLDELSRAAGERNERSLIDLDQRIHRHVARCAHNPFLEATLEEYYVLTLRIWFLALDRVERLDDAIREHHELLEAIRDGDADRAERVMQRHIVGFERAVRAVL